MNHNENVSIPCSSPAPGKGVAAARAATKQYIRRAEKSINLEHFWPPYGLAPDLPADAPKTCPKSLERWSFVGLLGSGQSGPRGGGVRPIFWGRRKTAGAREGRPFWLPVFRAAICASQSLLLRKRKGAAGPVGPTSGSESGPGITFRACCRGRYREGVGCCFLVAAWLPVGPPVCCLLGSLLRGCSGRVGWLGEV